ncbi:MAG TPA: ABC transporter ATP-binding protein [Balneolales bacterium]|nr:ABC transporter ATP-binding protein [Balneolales bacterium]
MSKILRVNKLSKSYQSGSKNLTVLHDISFEMNDGSTCAIVGPSGSGKTTLLGLCAGLDIPSSGEVFLNDTSLFSLDEDQRAQIRNEYVGFIFQTFQLIPTLTALENVMVPLELRGETNVQLKAKEWLERVELQDRLDHYPAQLSGGEQQRVAIARAFMNNPKILFADEPTGNLDNETGQLIDALLFELNEEEGTTLLLVTHDIELAQRCQRVIRLKNGSIFSDEMLTVGNSSRQKSGI